LHSTGAHEATGQARHHSQQGQPGYPPTDERGQPLSNRSAPVSPPPQTPEDSKR
jgi:hypothetical protein